MGSGLGSGFGRWGGSALVVFGGDAARGNSSGGELVGIGAERYGDEGPHAVAVGGNAASINVFLLTQDFQADQGAPYVFGASTGLREVHAREV
jgi:hypothetical protein